MRKKALATIVVASLSIVTTFAVKFYNNSIKKYPSGVCGTCAASQLGQRRCMTDSNGKKYFQICRESSANNYNWEWTYEVCP